MGENLIDFVVAWVDGGDKAWQEKRAKFGGEMRGEGADEARFRDWGIFKFWFRGIEKYADFVHKIYFISDAQIPKWLNTEHEKLQIVDHTDFIPQKYLPTFSANPIELNLHRIKGLSEYFVFFNDDTFVVNPMSARDFFIDGKPVDCGILNVHCVKKSRFIHQISLNDAAIINEHFEMRRVIAQNPRLWQNPKYGARFNLQNLILRKCPRFPGFKQFHLPAAMLKSVYERVWEREFDELDETCQHKFRSKFDVNQWLMREWNLCENNFAPCDPRGRGDLIDFEKPDLEGEFARLEAALRRKKMVCINDGDGIDFEPIKSRVLRLLEEKFQDKSKFEK